MGKLENGTIVKVIASDYDTRRLKGDLMVIRGYSKSYDSYYVQAYGGQTCCYLKAQDVVVVDEGNESV